MKCNKKIQSQINVPDGVKVLKKKQVLIFSGVLGKTNQDLTKIERTGLGTIKIGADHSTLVIQSQSKTGLYLLRSLLKNKIRGVAYGFLINLRIVGVGYRAFFHSGNMEKTRPHAPEKRISENLLSETFLNFKLGYSHNYKYQVPEGVRAFLLEPTLLCLFGIDKNQVSQVASIIRSFKPPERYKGKGIRFTTEKVILAQGKRK